MSSSSLISKLQYIPNVQYVLMILISIKEFERWWLFGAGHKKKKKKIADDEVVWNPQAERYPTFSNNQEPRDQK